MEFLASFITLLTLINFLDQIFFYHKNSNFQLFHVTKSFFKKICKKSIILVSIPIEITKKIKFFIRKDTHVEYNRQTID